MDLVWRDPRSDLGNRGHCGKVHAKTFCKVRFSYLKNGQFCFAAGSLPTGKEVCRTFTWPQNPLMEGFSKAVLLRIHVWWSGADIITFL
jgi:hypothetical protein